MKLVSSTEANRDFSKLLRAVARGEQVRITSRGRTVAVMMPADDRGPASSSAVKRLLRRLDALPAAGVRGWTRDELYG